MILDVFRSVGQLFIQYCSYRLPINGYDITIGSVFIFSGIALIIIKLVKGMAA